MGLKRRILLLKTVLWILGLAPLGWASYRFFLGDGLGVNPVEELELWSGLTTVTILLAALSVTPLRRVTGWNELQKTRRLIGLFAFFYAVLHFLSWLAVDQFFAWEYVIPDLYERPYILVGFTAFLMLVPLAVTSTKGWIRRLGRRWTRLHMLVYPAGLLGVIHWFWVTKADDRMPMLALGVWAVGIMLRVAFQMRGRRRTSGRRADVPVPVAGGAS